MQGHFKLHTQSFNDTFLELEDGLRKENLRVKKMSPLPLGRKASGLRRRRLRIIPRMRMRPIQP